MEKLSQALNTAFRNAIMSSEVVDSPMFLIDALKRIFTQKESFFHILEQGVQILNRSGKQRVNRDNVNKYLEVYKTTMEEVGQLRYINLPISIYGNIVRELDDNSSAGEKLIFGVLAGNDPNEMKIQLSKNELCVLLGIDKMDFIYNRILIRLKTPKLVDVLITTATLESQDRLFKQISNLLTFMGNQNLIDIESNVIEVYNAPNIWLRHVIFRRAIDRGLNDFVDRFMENELRLLVENKYFAFTQATEEGRVDILDLIWNFLPSNVRDSAFTAAVNGKAAFVRAIAHKEPIILDWLWDHAPSNEMRREMLRVGGYFIFDWAVSYGNVKVLKWLWDHVNSREEQHNIMNIGSGTERLYIIGIACESRNIENMVWVLDRAPEILAPNEIAEAFSKISASDVDLFFKAKFRKAIISDDIAELNSLWEKERLSCTNIQREELRANNCQAFGVAAREGSINALNYLWKGAESVNMQRAMLEADNYRAFVEAARNNHVNILNYLWGGAESLGMQRAMLGANYYKAFIVAIRENSIDASNYLWKKAELLNMRRAMLGADDFRAFLVAVSHDHIKIVSFLWKKAKSVNMQRAMLKADDYMAFVEAAQNYHIGMLDYLWKEAELLNMQRAMLWASNCMAFVEAAENNHVGTLDYLWKRARLLNMQRKMLRADGYKAFIVAARKDSIDALDRLWKKAEPLNMQRAMLEADGYGAFRAAAQKVHIGVLKFLWEKAGVVQRLAMLKANNYEALAHMIRDPVDVSLLKKFKLFINKESIVNSRFIQEITVQEWERCLETIANSGDEKVLDWIWKDFISLNMRQEIGKFYQKVRQRALEAKEPQPGPSSEYESLSKRPRIESGEKQHITGEASSVQGTH